MGKCDTLLTKKWGTVEWTAYTPKTRAERERGTKREENQRRWIWI